MRIFDFKNWDMCITKYAQHLRFLGGEPNDFLTRVRSQKDLFNFDLTEIKLFMWAEDIALTLSTLSERAVDMDGVPAHLIAALEEALVDKGILPVHLVGDLWVSSKGNRLFSSEEFSATFITGTMS